jgi:hypothetical protein
LWITNIKSFHITIFVQQTYLLSLLSLMMAKGKRGYKFTTTVVTVATAPIIVTSTGQLPLPAVAAALPQLLLPQPLSPPLLLPHSDDCCLPSQFLLLSATAIATVATAATTGPVLASIAIAACPHHRHHWHKHFHCHHHQCPCHCLCLHQHWPLLLPLPPPLFLHVLKPPQPPFLSKLLPLFSWFLSNPPLPLFRQHHRQCRHQCHHCHPLSVGDNQEGTIQVNHEKGAPYLWKHFSKKILLGEPLLILLGYHRSQHWQTMRDSQN